MTSVKLRRPTSGPASFGPRGLSAGLDARAPAGALRSGAIVAGLGLAAILAGWLIAHGDWKVVAALLVPIPVVLIIRAAPIAALVVLVVMNGVPIVNLGGRAAGIKIQDVAVVGLAVLLYVCRDQSPSAAGARYRRAARVWSALFIAFWAFTVARSVLLDAIPVRDAFVYGRDFLYFAVLLPLAFNVRFTPRSLRVAGLILLGAGALYATGQVVASVAGRTLVGLVHPVKVGDTVGLSRFFSPMNYLVETCLMFATALFFTEKSSRYRPILGVTALILAAGALLGLTRANYFGIIIAVLACLVVYIRRHGSLTAVLLRITVAILVLGSVLILFTAIAGHSGALSSNPVVTRVTGGVSDISHSAGTFAYRKTVDTEMVNALGRQWPIGLGFLYAPVHPVAGIPNGAIRNTDTGVFNIIMTMGLLGAIFIYAPFVYLIRELLRVSRRSGPSGELLPRWILYGGTAWFAWAIASSLTLDLLFSVPGVVLAAVVLAALGRAFVNAVEVPVVGGGLELTGAEPVRFAPRAAPASPLAPLGVSATASNGVGAMDRASNGVAVAVAERVPSLLAPPPVMSRAAVTTVGREPTRFEASLVGSHLSVVIVTYDSSGDVQRCIEALRPVLGDCEIIVVEKLPGDGTRSAVQSIDDRMKVISVGASDGYASGCNRGVTAASNEHVLVMTQDMVVEGADLSQLAATFDQADFGLIALSSRRDGEECARPQTFAPRSWSTELAALALEPLRPGGFAHKPQGATNGSAAWASGVLMLVRRTEFCSLGGFDERYSLYFEHDDLGARYRDAGLPIGTADAVKAVHYGRQSAPEDGGPRVDPMAWYLLGWLEFVAVEYGERRARLSWLVIRTAHRTGQRLAELGASLGVRRLRRKAQQLSSVEADLIRLCDTSLASRHESCSAVCQVVRADKLPAK